MELSKLINSIRVIQVSGEVERKDINGIFCDSRKLKNGSLFVAIEGLAADGHRYITEAMAKGVSAVILQNDTIVPDEMFRHAKVTKILVADSRKTLADVSRAYFKNPAKRLRLIGCSGTNGKTTVTWIVKHLLDAAGYKTGLLGTIANYIGKEKLEAALTTPESNDLNEMLAGMVSAGCSHAVMEVSSHAAALDRIHGLAYTAGIFTNLTQDHLDFHGTMENYRDAKKKFYDGLASNALAVSNIDDAYGTYMLSGSAAGKLYYGAAAGADYHIRDVRCGLSGTSFTLAAGGTAYAVDTKLFGLFNAYNLTAALAVCANAFIPLNVLVEMARDIPQVPGRFEQLSGAGRTVIIDYSHTPDSLEKTLLNIRQYACDSKKIVTVFGCGGNRDKSKRPLMGKIATELSDSVIITSDNPREENPIDIIEDIARGAEVKNYNIEPDRKAAIAKAIRESGAGTIILIAGKGHEDYQVIGKQKIHLSDKETALDYLGESEHV